MPSVVAGLDVICAQFVISVWTICGVVVIATAVLLWRSRRHRVRRSVIAGGLCVLLTLTATAASVNAYYAYLPTVGDAAQAATGDRQWVPAAMLTRLSPSRTAQARERGLVVRLSLPADRRDGFGSSTSIAYLPPQYFTMPDARFPVVYLFHGSPGQAADWFHAGQAPQIGRQLAAAGRPAILVAPRLSATWTDDPECVDGAREKVETHLLDHVIPSVDAALRTRADRDDRVFAGMSAGGYCALNLGLRNRSVAATIIDMSGDTSPTHSGGAASLFGRHNADAAALVAANDPARYAATLAAGPPSRVWLDSGTQDTSIVRQMAALEPVLRARGLDVVWRVRPGGHTYWVWTAALREALPWALGQRGPSHPRSHPGPV